MFWVIVAVVVAWLLYRWLRRAAGQGSTTPSSSPPQSPGVSRPPVTTRPRTAPAGAAAPPRRNNTAPASGGLFAYPGSASAGGATHEGPYAVIDVETTGFSPQQGDRIIEIAIARVDADGRVEDEFATLVNPQGRDTGPVFVHGISNEAVKDAPTFPEIAPELLARLEGAVVVAHNAPFEERFLAAELAASGHTALRLPALCTLWLGKQTFTTANYKLATLAREAGVSFPDKHAALGDVRAVAALLPHLFDRYGQALHYPCAPHRAASRAVGGCRPVTRAVGLRKGEEGWMHSLMSRLPMNGVEVDDYAAAAYLDTLAEVLADGKIVGEEATQLAALAGTAGMGAAQVRSLNEGFLEAMREAAYADGILTSTELRDLTRAARALGVADYFDDLTTSARSHSAPASTVEPAGNHPVAVRRCGHCRTPGHYRSTCPELATTS